MYTAQPKKLIIMNILDILKKYTDENHRLSQKEIAEILEKEYMMTVDRKAIKRNLMNLIDFGFDIEYTEKQRNIVTKNGETEESYILTDFYLNREFTDSELRVMIDSLLFSKHLDGKQFKTLVDKIEGLSNKYFHSKVKHIKSLTDNRPSNSQLFYTIDILDEAIEKGLQVEFKYNTYDVDKKLHPRTNSEGNPRKYIINPYKIVAANGCYYLICNYDKYDNYAHYRIDRITDITLLDTKAKDIKNVKGLENGINLPKHLAEHIYMFTGESAKVQFIAKRYIVGEVIDWFGKDVKFADINDEEVTVTVNVNPTAMEMWAMQYSKHIKIISPDFLVENIKTNLKNALANYEK